MRKFFRICRFKKFSIHKKREKQLLFSLFVALISLPFYLDCRERLLLAGDNFAALDLFASVFFFADFLVSLLKIKL